MSVIQAEIIVQLEQWYKGHHHWLRNWLNHRLGNVFDAEDLSHDTFIRASHSKIFLDVKEPRHYLISVAKGLSIDLFRRQTLERQYFDALASAPQDYQVSEEQHALILETLVQLDEMLDGLGHSVKQVFILSQLEGLTYSQISDELGVSLRTVNNYMAKAMEHCCLFQMQLSEA